MDIELGVQTFTFNSNTSHTHLKNNDEPTSPHVNFAKVRTSNDNSFGSKLNEKSGLNSPTRSVI